MIAGDLPTEVPRKNGELVFEAPWESRAFGVVAAYLDTTGNGWDHFRPPDRRDRRCSDDTPYYESWVHALEDMLAADGIAASA